MRFLSLALATTFPTLAAGLVAGISMGFPACAQEVSRESLAVVDTDGDGAVTKEELVAAMDAAFQELDTDRNGALSESEAGIWITVAQFRSADKNANGQLSKEEYIATVLADFAAADKNADGKLD